MPTEAEIEAAARKICADLDGNPYDRAQGIEDGRIRWSWYADAARSALTAAEEVRGQAVPDGWVLVPKEPTHEMENAMFGSVGDDDEKMLSCLGDLIDMSPNKTWLAIRAAYRAALASAPKPAVPDEAAIRADERERLAKVMEAKAAEQYGLAREKTDGSFGGANVATYNGVTAASYLFSSVAIRAAAPKPEDKR